MLSLKVLLFSKMRSPTLLSFSFHFRFLDLWVKHSIFAFVSDNKIGRDVIFPRSVKIIVNKLQDSAFIKVLHRSVNRFVHLRVALKIRHKISHVKRTSF